MTPPLMLWYMLCAHCLADYPLQGDFLAKGKNPVAPLPGVPWPTIMAAHALIHAGFVTLITGSMALGFVEAWAHAIIDYNKCKGRLSFNTDQILHVACKAVYALILLRFGPLP